MVEFSYYLNKDYFKIGNFGDKKVKYINIALLSKIILINKL
jgi:hypothetical protein